MIKVVFVGGASTGKSSLCNFIANKLKKPIRKEDYLDFMKRNNLNTLEEFKPRNADFVQEMQNDETIIKNEFPDAQVLFCDNAPLSWLVGFEIVFGEHNQALADITEQMDYDIYILCENELEFEDDGIRPSKEYCDTHHAKTIEFLDNNGITYHTVSGTIEERTLQVEGILKNVNIQTFKR